MTITITLADRSYARGARGWIAGLLALAACDVVDETGWVCLDGSIAETRQQCLDLYASESFETDAADPPSDSNTDDVAGAEGGRGFDPSLLLITAVTPIGDTPGPVTVVGLPGVNPGQGPVSLQVDGARILEAQVDGTSFVGVVTARSGSVVRVLAGGEEVAALTVTGPSIETGGQPPPSSPLATFVDEDVDGGGGPSREINFGDGQLAIPAPYVVFNETSGEVVAVQQGTYMATVTVWTGDTVCVFGTPDGGEVGTALCQVF